MPVIYLEDIARHDVDRILPPDGEFAESYETLVTRGRDLMAGKSIAFVAICRNAMPFVQFTLARVEELGKRCGSWVCYVYENDSTDGTKDFLSSWSGGNKIAVMTDNGRPHLSYSKEASRTVALAEYRDHCREWVKNEASVDYVVVFDTDPWGGFSLDGVCHSLALMATKEHRYTACMASYSLCQWGPPVWPSLEWCQYDAWACRWNHWRERQDMRWFHQWHPPVGSAPVKMNSAFGQLAIYRASDYVLGKYRGDDDCEHVSFHKSLGGDLFLNPSQRVVSFWAPDDNKQQAEGRDLHGDLRSDVDGGDTDANNR